MSLAKLGTLAVVGAVGIGLLAWAGVAPDASADAGSPAAFVQLPPSAGAVPDTRLRATSAPSPGPAGATPAAEPSPAPTEDPYAG